MIESTVISLREGIEIALVLGILVVYLRKVGQDALIRSVYLGLACAFLASIGGALILQHFAVDQESLEGFFMLIAAAFVISMILWMWVTARKIRSEIEDRVNSIIAGSSTWKVHLGVFSFTFLLIVREGIETVVFLQAVALSAGAWRSLIGTVIGITCAAVFAILFIRGSVKIDIARFLKVTAITLLIFAVQLILDAVHEFYEFGIFPANPKMMGILGPVVQNDVLFIIAIVSIPALMLMIPGRKSARTPATQNQRRWQLSGGLASIGIILFLGVGDIYSSNADKDFSSESIAVPQDSVIRIPLAKVDDGKIHRYSVKVDSLEIRFFALRMSFGRFATAFDACYACYSYGHYYLKNGQLICSQCDAPSPLSTLKESATGDIVDADNSGSMAGNRCAPIYLPSHIEHGNISITMNDLQSKRKYFDIGPESK